MTGRILIADDLVTNRIFLRVKLGAARYEVLQAASAADAFDMARREAPDLIVLNTRIGDGAGVDLCHVMKSSAETEDIPLILLTAKTDRSVRLAALHAGADEILTRPLDDITLLARVRSLLRARETWKELRRRRTTAAALGFAEEPPGFSAPGRIALVAAEAETAEQWKAGLSTLIPDPIAALSSDAALDAAPGEAADLFVIGADPGCQGGGLGLLSELRSRAPTRHAAILLVHGREDGATGATALDMGANDLLQDGFDCAELAIRIRTQLRRKQEGDRLRATVEQGLRMAATDPLTGLYNRRYALTHLDRLGRDAARGHQPFAVMVGDLDFFKNVNDTYGHAAGDAVLAAVAARLRDNLRGEDLVARIGGEEFLIAMPDTDLARAEAAADRLCRLIAATPVKLPGRAGQIGVTMSIGVAMGGAEAEAVPALLDRADRALYRAKADGRNKIDISRPAA